MYASLNLCCGSSEFGGVMIQLSCTLYSHTKILNSAQILGSFSIFFRTLLYAHIIISCFPLVRRTLWLPTSPLVWICAISSSCNLWVLNTMCLPSTNYLWIGVLHSTHILRSTYMLEEHILYWPSKFFRPFWQSMPMGEKFRGFSLRRFMLWLCS